MIRLKIFLLIFVLAGSAMLVGTVGTVSAQYDLFQGCDGSGAEDTSVCENQGNDTDPLAGPDGILITAVKLISYFVGVVSVFMIMYAGFKYIVSAGDPNSVSTAKNIIIYSVIGLAVAVFAQAIIIFVINRI